MPRTARSITDQRNRVIYIPQRNDLRTRAARSVVLQTLGHFALGPQSDRELRGLPAPTHRVELLRRSGARARGPRGRGTHATRNNAAIFPSKTSRRLFYISYEMAAHRFTNLATKHLGLPVHFLRTDPEGVIEKAYENDGIPYPTDDRWRARGRAGVAPMGRTPSVAVERFVLTPLPVHPDRRRRVLVCHLLRDRRRLSAPSRIGTTAAHARYFRGANTLRRVNARTVDNEPDPDLVGRWEGVSWPSAAERATCCPRCPRRQRPFTPFPGVDLSTSTASSSGSPPGVDEPQFTDCSPRVPPRATNAALARNTHLVAWRRGQWSDRNRRVVGRPSTAPEGTAHPAGPDGDGDALHRHLRLDRLVAPPRDVDVRLPGRLVDHVEHRLVPAPGLLRRQDDLRGEPDRDRGGPARVGPIGLASAIYLSEYANP